MAPQETKPLTLLRERAAYEFSEFQVSVAQGLINGWDRKTFKENNIRTWQIDQLKDKLAEEFCGFTTIGGFFLAIREMVRQELLDLHELPERLAAEPNDYDILVWASMYNGLNPLKACQLLGLGEFSGWKLKSLRNGLIRKLGFKNHYQAVAWWAREKIKQGL